MDKQNKLCIVYEFNGKIGMDHGTLKKIPEVQPRRLPGLCCVEQPI